MKLEIGEFYVKDIIFGSSLSFDKGVLTINKDEALKFIKEDVMLQKNNGKEYK